MNEIPVEQMEQHCGELVAGLAGGDFSAGLRDKVRPIMLQAVRDNFTSSATPEGVSWPARKVIGDGHPLLMDTGALLQASTGGGTGHVTIIERDAVEVGTDGTSGTGGNPYAAVHNRGAVNMPQREFMGASEKRLREIDEQIADIGLQALERVL